MTFSHSVARVRTFIYDVSTSRFGVLIVVAIAVLLSAADRNYGFFFGLGVALIIVKEHGWDWSVMGFGQRITVRTVLIAIALAAVSYLAFGVIDALLELKYGAIDLSSVEDIKGNFVGYAVLMIIMWVFAAFGEELLFRGYYMQWTARMFGSTTTAWLVAAVLTSVYFGVSHSYQGMAGAISVGLGGLFQAMIYFFNRRNLALGALVHGFFDSIGLTLIFLDKYDVIGNWVLGQIQ